MIKINIAGDFCITQPFLLNDCFSEEVTSFFEKSDLNILNLECPISEGYNTNKILKTGPNLYTTEGIITHLKKINIHAVTLANNHILDFGAKGLENTIRLCSNNQITTIGAGTNLKEATKPVIIEKQGIRIGIINFCENEWSIATETSSGANPLNIIDNLTQINQVRGLVDFLLIIIHGGHEYYNLPSPRMVKQYRFFAENGADAVIGHHPHCISGYEIHNKVPIFYSLGNFLFTLNSKYEDFYTGLILQLIINDNKELKFKLQPIRQNKDNFKLSKLHGDERNDVMKQVDGYSDIIVNEQLLFSKWEQLINSRSEYFLDVFSPINLFSNSKVRGLLKKLGISLFFRRKQHYRRILNIIRCESHLDVSINAIRNHIN